STSTAWRAPVRWRASWRSSSASGRGAPSSASATCVVCRGKATWPAWRPAGCSRRRWCARRPATRAAASCSSMKPRATVGAWPCTGIALAAFVLLGYDVWPAVLAGSFLVNITTAGSVATALGIAAGNTLEGLAGAYLVNRFARGRRAFDRPQDVFAFTVLAGIVSTTVGATVGVTTLAFTGFARWAEYGAIWGTLHGFGPFVRATRNESLLLLQAFMGVTSVMTLALAALVAERSQVEERLRQLAVSDPLTGLANYRQLTYAIDAEIKRYQRT